MNCNDCGGFLPRGCECSPFGGRKTRADDEAFQQHQRDRIAEAQRHDAEQAKPKLTDGVAAVPSPFPDIAEPATVERLMELVRTLPPRSMRAERDAYLTEIERIARGVRVDGEDGPSRVAQVISDFTDLSWDACKELARRIAGLTPSQAPSYQEVIAAALEALEDNDNHAATVILKTAAARGAALPSEGQR